MKALGRVLAFAVSLVATPALAQSAPIEASVQVDTARPGPTIDRAIYGQFAEHLGRGIYEGVWVGPGSRIPNTRGYRTDVLDALKRIRVPVVRWPGGCFADEYDWKDGIGPRARRPKRVNTIWGYVTEDNSFGTHEFMDFAELLGADAYVAGNMGSMEPRAMSQWLEYMTSEADSDLVAQRKRNGRERPWQVKYFGVGNETWGCGGNMRPEYSADLHKRYAAFLRPGLGQKPVRVASGANVDDYNYTQVLMDRARDQMDALSLHYYTFVTTWQDKKPATGFGEGEWASTLVNALKMEDLIRNHKAIMDRYDPQKRIGLYVDEWGTWYKEEPGSKQGFLYQQNSLRDAHVAALHFNIFHRHTDRVRMTNIAQMVNVLQALILTDGARMVLTPTYHVFDMYQPFQGAAPLFAEAAAPAYRFGESNLPSVDVTAARGTDGKVWLALVNLDPNRPARVTSNLSGTATGRLLTGPALDTHNTFDNPNAIRPAAYQGRVENGRLSFDLPPKSIAVVSVE